MDFSHSYPTPEILHQQSVSTSWLPKSNDYHYNSLRIPQTQEQHVPLFSPLPSSELSASFARTRGVQDWNNGSINTQVPNYLLQPIYPWMKSKKGVTEGNGMLLFKR